MTGSQTPELFSDHDDEDDDEGKLSSSQSTCLSNHASLDRESPLSDTLILQPEQRRREHGQLRTNSASPKKESDVRSVQSEPGELSASQVSSDFDIPCTPESKTPQADELSQLYRKLASGEEVVMRKGSQGSM
ncbi:protein artemis-like [Centroberyx affinis]|uniref:protein artemis-like n=1 Tax=Centroberyx affinis TaxID=166261 RepID=UPI003A5BD7DD